MPTQDTFDFDLEEEEAEEKSNANFAALRKHAKELDKTRKEQAAELEELRKLKADVEQAKRISDASTAFKEAGLNEKHAKLFEATNAGAEITAEAIKAFAEEYGLGTVVEKPADEVTPAPEPAREGFKPVTTGTHVDTGQLSIDDASKMIREGKYDEVQKLYEQGRVTKLERDANGAPVVDWLEGMR